MTVGTSFVPVMCRRIDVRGNSIFYRESGPADAPVVLLPHGYPCSSYEFRNLMGLLGDRWRCIAPDYPSFGFSDAPSQSDFLYTFDGYSEFLADFADRLALSRYAIYLHDYGSQFGLRLAMRNPEAVSCLIIQNGDIYEDAHGPKYEPLKEFWRNPTPSGRKKISEAVSKEGFRDEFVGEVAEEVACRIPPDLWELAWSQVSEGDRHDNLVSLLCDQASTLDWFSGQQKYLRDHQPPTLIVWGPQDGYMPEESCKAYLRDLPDAEMHILPDAGHWLLETHLTEAVRPIREFLTKHHPNALL